MSETETGRRKPGLSEGGITPPDPARRMSASELIALEDEAAAGSAGGAVPTTPDAPTVLVDPDDAPRTGGTSAQAGKVRVGDRVFQGLAASSGVLVVLLIAAVAAFLIIRAIPALGDDDVNFLTSREWAVDGTTLRFGVAALLWVTVISSIVAMVLAVPVGVGIALFITMYAPRRLAGPVARVVDLLAAIPSIVYGVWGLLVLGPAIQPVANVLQSVLGSWFPLFADQNVQVKTIFTAGVVLAIMILPIITAVSRDVFERTPRANIEASLALGATRWEMIRMAVLPYGKAGVTSGAMLGLGRALGETIAVTLILSTLGGGAAFSFSIFTGGETFASKIANNAAEFSQPTQTGAYIAAGLVLFLLTFVVNAAARLIVSRGGAK